MALSIRPDNQVSKSSAAMGVPNFVSICNAPVQGRRLVQTILIYNADTIAHTWRLFFNSEGTRIPLKHPVPFAGSGEPGTAVTVWSFENEDWLAILKPAQFLEAQMDSARATTEATYLVTYVDEE